MASRHEHGADLLFRQELRQRFMKAESTLFRIRFDTDSADERQRFLESLNFDWQPVRIPSSAAMAALIGMTGLRRRKERSTRRADGSQPYVTEDVRFRDVLQGALDESQRSSWKKTRIPVKRSSVCPHDPADQSGVSRVQQSARSSA